MRGTLYLDEADITYAGEVVWVKPGDPQINLRATMGVRFTDLDGEARQLIGTALVSRRTAPAS